MVNDHSPAKEAEQEAVLGASVEMRDHESMMSMVWRRLRRHHGAMVSSAVLLALLLAVILVGFSPYDPERSDIMNRLEPPSLEHPFGTDALGQDLLTRCLYGGRVSLAVGFMVVVITLSIGIPVGAVSGYFRGGIDNVLMRITDTILSLPTLLVLILMSAMLREMEVPFVQRNNVLTIALAIGVLSWMVVARLVRATFMSLRETEYVTAAHSVGASTPRIILRHILPNAVGPIVVQSTLLIGWAIMWEAGLSFLGFGIQPPTPSWGNLLSNAPQHMTKHPWLAFFPGLMIFLTIISINYIGDGLRDAFDPQGKT